ncbi:MAG: hypothetical protein NY202_02705 [Mollicutes bacterium UO1]
MNIPRKTLYLPSDEITDTVAHESAHIPTWEEYAILREEHGTV